MGAVSGLACAGKRGRGMSMRRFLRMGAAVATLCWGGGVIAQTPPERVGPATWLTDDDYPAEALRRGEEGVVKFAIDVDRRGRVAGCRILQSGGLTLDEATCRGMVTRLRFKPARDADGKAAAGVWQREMRWRLPSRSAVK
ncbi:MULTISPECIES: energy transducer TonB [unclassified Sphingomonas]|uniref:energy transducer TonB n=1 Tax=unclassified Sphingomonas TaxID=196159 RepID=UPI0009EBFA85